MMEENQDFVFMDSIKVLQRNMGILFNNAKYSDTTFIVKEKKFHALSQLVSVSSSTLDSLISSHVAHCTDKEIKINDVKNAESFTIILRYVYGLEINFSQLDKTILCEVLNLSEIYKLPEFTNSLKEYLAKVEMFTIDTLAVLLNTAKKFNMDDLYEKLSIYAYLNAEEFVKHESIKDVQYDVLLDLLKSNWFYAEEINILRGVLNWHSDMYCKKEARNIEEAAAKENDGEELIEEEDVRSDMQSDASDCETDLSMDNYTLSDKNSKEALCTEVMTVSLDLDTIAEHTGNNSNENHEETKVVIPNQAERQVEVIETFSESVLKSLLSHIRIKQISMFDYFKESKTKLFKKHMRILAIDEHFSQRNEPRQKYINCPVRLEPFNDTKRTFIHTTHPMNQLCAAEEQHLIGDLKWNVCLKILQCNNNVHNYNIEMYVECISDEPGDWECEALCQLTLISDKTTHPNLVLPADNLHMLIEFTPNKSLIYVGKYYKDSDAWLIAYYPSGISQYVLTFKSIQIKGKSD